MLSGDGKEIKINLDKEGFGPFFLPLCIRVMRGPLIIIRKQKTITSFLCTFFKLILARQMLTAISLSR